MKTNAYAISLFDLLLVLLLLAVGGLWYFGRTHPIEVREERERVPVTCEQCHGSGKMKCPACGGFGSVEVQVACKACSGTGKMAKKKPRGPDAPCPKCQGKGTVRGRAPCETCDGTGILACSRCEGSGTRLSEEKTTEVVVMLPSLWERTLALVGVSVPSNPPPQRVGDGYPLITRDLELKAKKAKFEVKEWGHFVRSGDEWTMFAQILCSNKTGQVVERQVDFVVKDRTLRPPKSADASVPLKR